MVNLDNISYYFQIPLNWYKKVHNACFNSVPANYIDIKPQNDGKNIIGIDLEGLKEYLDVGSSDVSSITINDSSRRFESDDEGNINIELDHNSLSDWSEATSAFVTTDTEQDITGAKTIYGNLYFTDAEGYGNSGIGKGNVGLWIDDDTAVILGSTDTGANNVRLTVQPTETANDSLAVATCGYAQSKFVQKDSSNTGLIHNDKGTISYKSFGTTAGTVSEGNHTHTSDDITDLGSAATMDVGTASGTVAAGNHNHDSTYLKSSDASSTYLKITDRGSTTSTNAVQPYSATLKNIVDGNHFDTNGKIEATAGTYIATTSGNKRILCVNANSSAVSTSETVGSDMVLVATSTKLSEKLDTSGNVKTDSIASMTASKWVKTNASGKLTTTDDNPITASSTSTGYVFNTKGTVSYKSYKSGTTDITVVTGISFNGTNLIATKSKLTFTDGILTGVASASSDSIGTVTYNPT